MWEILRNFRKGRSSHGDRHGSVSPVGNRTYSVNFKVRARRCWVG